MGAAAIVLTAAQGVMGAYGARQAGMANQRAAEREADVLDYRASLVEEQGSFGAQQIRKQGKAIQGSQKTGYASQGVVVGDGSSGQMIDQTAVLSEEDALQTKLNAAREAWGLKTQAKVTRYQGDVANYKSKMDMIGGLVGTGASIAGTAASMNKGSTSSTKAPTYESTGRAIFPMDASSKKNQSFLDAYKNIGKP